MFVSELSAYPRTISDKYTGAVGGKIVLVCLAISVVFSVLFWVGSYATNIGFLPQNISGPMTEDLVVFYRAGQLAREGHAEDAYDFETFRAPLAGKAHDLPFVNPPHFFPVTELMALLPYATVKVIMLLVSTLSLALLAVVLKMRAHMVAFFLLSATAVQILVILNISQIIILMLAFAVVCAADRPILAGLCLALATVKPQYGILIPVYLLALGQIRSMVWTVVWTALILAATWVVYGSAPFYVYATMFSHEPYASRLICPGEGMLTVNAMLTKIGIVGLERSVLYGAEVVFCVALVWVAARRLSRNEALGFLFLATACAAPSFTYYSWSLIAAAHFCFLRAQPTWSWPVQVAMGLLWLQPMLSPIQRTIAPQVNLGYSAFVTFTVLVALAVWVWELRDRLLGREGEKASLGFGEKMA